jgi:hypothetical protein
VNREARAEQDQRQNQKHDEQSHHFLLVVVRTDTGALETATASRRACR